MPITMLTNRFISSKPGISLRNKLQAKNEQYSNYNNANYKHDRICFSRLYQLIKFF